MNEKSENTTLEVKQMSTYEENALARGEFVVSIIGSGGIGSNLAPHIARALRAGELIEQVGPVRLRLIDGDLIEQKNLMHQNFSTDEVGQLKTRAVIEGLLECQHEFLKVESIPFDVREATFISTSDIVIVAVDSMVVRKLVHRYAEVWLDLRCQGDAYIALDYRVDPVVVSKLTPLNSESASCQLPGAREAGNIQFGHLLAGAHGSQWLIQFLRGLSGEENFQLPSPQTANITFGTLSRFDLHTPTIDPRAPVEAHIHEAELLGMLIETGEHDSLPIRETLAAFARERDWKQLWDLADRMEREVSILFDADNQVWVDVGTAGQVRLAPPDGARIPFKQWIHTHPRDAYWSSTDLDSLLIFSQILEEAIVLGHNHFKRARSLSEPVEECLERGSALERWTDETVQNYSELEVLVDGC